jgi:apolipoprotein D and lipocalin family protein
MPFILSSLFGCISIPSGVSPLSNFQQDKYLGTWYEIARSDNSFEKNLNQVSAEYSLKSDGGINVVNKGYDTVNKKWKSVTGKAYFIDNKSFAHLKVSFFGPFYSSYIVFKVDENYKYALVSSYDKSYIWLLSREKSMPANIKKEFLDYAGQIGFDTDKLIDVNQ